jgi:predicted DNA-binding transcriptional regulator AlpA
MRAHASLASVLLGKASENQFNDRLIWFPELEKIFGVCKRTVRRKAESGELPPLRRIGRVVGMLESHVKAYFQKLSHKSVGFQSTHYAHRTGVRKAKLGVLPISQLFDVRPTNRPGGRSLAF